MEAVDGADVVLLQYSCIKHLLRAPPRLLLGLENEYDVVLFWQFPVPDHFSHLQQYGGVAVMSAAVPRGQCVNIAADGYGGQRTVLAPHGYDSKTSHMGVDGVGTGRGKTLHN